VDFLPGLLRTGVDDDPAALHIALCVVGVELEAEGLFIPVLDDVMARLGAGFGERRGRWR
jgi:hypothetical protein